MSRSALVLADGEVFVGETIGAEGVGCGEIVFNTAMTGYQEVLTDPSYAGQIVTMTTPHIGNYGVTAADEQAAGPQCAGFVMRAASRVTSNWRSQSDLPSYLAAAGIPGITDIDTRRLTRHLRTRGAMAAAMGDAEVADLQATAVAHGDMTGRDLVSGVTTLAPYTVRSEGPTRGRVVAYDLGMKTDILAQLTRRGLEVLVVPADTPADVALGERPDGIFLSNGPGDPEPVTASVEAVRGLLGRLPVFGICLGHQILGLALGASTYKLPFGHHGGNHPVRRLSDGTVAITSQNHGFAVDLWRLAGQDPPPTKPGIVPGPELVPEVVSTPLGRVAATHQNLNDGTLEGLQCLDVPAFSVQYHPEAAPGPNDAVGLFDDFLNLMNLMGAASAAT